MATTTVEMLAFGFLLCLRFQSQCDLQTAITLCFGFVWQGLGSRGLQA